MEHVYDKMIEDKMHSGMSRERAELAVMEFVARLNVPPSTIAQACTLTNGIKGIVINDGWANDYIQFTARLKQRVDQGVFPIGCTTPRSVIDHEIGHHLDTLYRLSAREDIQNIYNKHTREEIVKGLSTYAAETDIHEFIAEAWAEFCNNANPRPIALEIGTIITQLRRKP